MKRYSYLFSIMIFILCAMGALRAQQLPCNKWFPLHQHAAKGNILRLKTLLGMSACVNGLDKIGWTPLMHASYRGQLAAVKFLVEHGADVDIYAHYPSPHGGSIVLQPGKTGDCFEQMRCYPSKLSPFLLSVAAGARPVFDYLFERVHEPGYILDCDHNNALLVALDVGNQEMMAHILLHPNQDFVKAQLLHCNYRSETMFSYNIDDGKFSRYVVLKYQQLGLDARDRLHNNALLYALLANNYCAFTELLQAGYTIPADYSSKEISNLSRALRSLHNAPDPSLIRWARANAKARANPRTKTDPTIQRGSAP